MIGPFGVVVALLIALPVAVFWGKGEGQACLRLRVTL